MGWPVAKARAWLDLPYHGTTEQEVVASLLAIEPCAEVERPDPMVAAFLEVASAVRAQPAPVVNLKVGDVTVNTSDRPVVVNVPPPVAMEKIAIRNADGVIERLVERPVQQSKQP